MTGAELMRSRFSAVSIEAAVRFGTNEIRVGTPAPDFELPDLQGRLVPEPVSRSIARYTDVRQYNLLRDRHPAQSRQTDDPFALHATGKRDSSFSWSTAARHTRENSFPSQVQWKSVGPMRCDCKRKRK